MRNLLRSWWTRSLVALLLLGVLGYWAAWEVLRSQWLAEQIRQRAIAEVEKATGGKAELKSFAFDWKLWRAHAEGFVLRGREPEGSPPLVEVPRAEVDLKVLSFLDKKVNVAAVRLEKPRMHLVRDAEGHWNFPEPAVARKRTKTPVETVLDLAIGELVVRGAEVHYEDRIVPVDFTAREFEAQLRYERAARAYAGTFAMKQSRLAEPLAVPVTFDLSGPLRLDAAGMTVTGAEAKLGASTMRADVALRDWKEPVVTIDGEGTVRVADLHKPLRLPVEALGEVKARGRLTAGGGHAWQAEGTAQAQGLAYAAR
ncbi:MAG: AsmA family protein, partial [Acidobacteria bacterium]|nr:AsmA family protein [Acidobacteriota bacterium]